MMIPFGITSSFSKEFIKVIRGALFFSIFEERIIPYANTKRG